MRSNTTYPLDGDLELFQTTKEFWGKGLLDDYSEDHFLIRALNNAELYFRKLFLRMHIHNLDYHSFPWNFVVNLNMKAKNLIHIFGTHAIENFFQNQFAAGKNIIKKTNFSKHFQNSIYYHTLQIWGQQKFQKFDMNPGLLILLKTQKPASNIKTI